MSGRRKARLNNHVSNTLVAIVLLVTVIFIGIIGYELIEGYSFEQALYMTVITMSTVGFNEVKPLSAPGHYFTVFLLFASIGIFAYVLGTFSKFIIDGGFRDYYFNRKLDRRIKRMKGHVIICGYGRNGKQATIELMDHKYSFIVIESNDDVIQRLNEDGVKTFVQGDATHDEILERAGIQKAEALITTLPSDADNTFVVISARSLNPNLRIISRASEEHSDVKIKRAGADNVIMPDRIGGIRMAKLVAQPDVVEFIDNILLQTESKVKLEEIDGNYIDDCFLKGSIKDLQLRTNSGATIIGIKSKSGEYIFNPSPDNSVNCDDKLFVLGSPDQIKKLRSIVEGSGS
ncbi:MAG: potassium channel protein [Bacteroidetes bacterium]|nr:potassium channel protein [Bacteroidota bacterium]MBT4409766.1 potassium channel protein [Bacteroidota bacterium]